MLYGGFAATIRARARLHAAVADLGAEQFRVLHHRWPADLAEVETALEIDLPDDSYTGQKLRDAATDTTTTTLTMISAPTI